MKKILTTSLLALSMAVTSAHAIKVQSGSKYPIVVEAYEWSSVCQDKASSASKAYSGSKKAYKSGGLFAAFKEGISGAVTGSGCDKIGKATVLLNKGDSYNYPAGALIVAYKDPLMAYSNANDKGKKIVNPSPAIIKLPDSGSILLETRKSKTLGSIIGMKGDFGLKATLK